jgi:hypothetical protein
MQVAFYSDISETQNNYPFEVSPTIQEKYELNKLKRYNVKKFPNIFLSELHKILLKKEIKVQHYRKIKNINKINLIIVQGSFYSKKLEDISNIKKKKYLILGEQESIQPKLYNKKFLEKFDKIFTYRPELVDNKRIFYLNCSLLVTTKIKNILVKNKKYLSCAFFANKKNKNPLSDFNERIKLIRYFSEKDKNYFHLYGLNWDHKVYNYQPKNTLEKIINLMTKIITKTLSKIKFINFILLPEMRVWKGFIKNQMSVCGKYKFEFCYENSSNMTARPFLSFYAGTVPIYNGPNNIKEIIPSSCYIDKKQFKSYDELLKFILSINKKKYAKYINNIKKFLKSSKHYKYSIELDAKTITKNIFIDLKKLK